MFSRWDICWFGDSAQVSLNHMRTCATRCSYSSVPSQVLYVTLEEVQISLALSMRFRTEFLTLVPWSKAQAYSHSRYTQVPLLSPKRVMLFQTPMQSYF